MTYNKEQLDEAFNQLPKVVQDFILSDEVAESVRLMAEEYKIPQDTKDNFALGIFALSVGLGSVDEFLKELTQEHKVDEETAFDVLSDIDELIFEQLDYLLDQEESTPPTTNTPTAEIKEETVQVGPMPPIAAIETKSVQPAETPKEPQKPTPPKPAFDPYREPLE